MTNSSTSSPEEIKRVLDSFCEPIGEWACGCMGPQGDEPRCPCAMRNVIKWRGKWIEMTEVVAPSEPNFDLDVLVPDDTPISELTPAQRQARLAKLRNK